MYNRHGDTSLRGRDYLIGGRVGDSRSGEDLPLGARNLEGPMRAVSLRQELSPPNTDDDTANQQDLKTKQDNRKRRKSAVQEVIETLLLAVLIFVGVRSIVLNFRVDGQSMEPNLLNGEMLIVNRRAYVHFNVSWLPWESNSSSEWYPFGKPSRGDIVVFNPPGQHTEPYIKRIIGLPGERISVHDGSVFINDERLNESYLTSSTEWRGIATEDVTIQPGYVFVMGDNRNNSSDSRVFGPVPISSIIGKAWVSYWPLSHAKVLTDPSFSLAR
jgi:signal peptidase I